MGSGTIVYYPERHSSSTVCLLTGLCGFELGGTQSTVVIVEMRGNRKLENSGYAPQINTARECIIEKIIEKNRILCKKYIFAIDSIHLFLYNAILSDSSEITPR
jgi:hypothetical protein